MRSRGISAKWWLVALLGAAALSQGHAAEKIEFSPPSSTAPTVVKPGRKNQDLRESLSLPETTSGGDASGLPGATMAPAPLAPSKATMDRMSDLLDRKKNWLVPGSQDRGELTVMDSFARKDGSKGFGGELDRKESIMERYMREGDAKPKSGETRSDSERRREGTNPREGRGNRDGREERDADGGRDNRDAEGFDPSRRDQNGLASFDLKGFISRAQSGRDADLIKDADTTRALQSMKSDFTPTQDTRGDRDRELAREREATRSAEFMQLLKPRSGGGLAASSSATFSDPLNSPDRTSRDLNPIMPRAGFELPTRSAMPETAIGPSRIQGNSMFGAAIPAAAALPEVTRTFEPPTAPASRPSQNIMIAPPTRRVGF